MEMTRRSLLASAAALGPWTTLSRSWAQPAPSKSADRVFICDEESNTLSVIDPERNAVVQRTCRGAFLAGLNDDHPQNWSIGELQRTFSAAVDEILRNVIKPYESNARCTT